MEITKLFTLSTSHIKQESIDFIESAVLSYFQNSYGYIIYINNLNLDGFPQDLIGCINLAKSNDCYWLHFDVDGMIIEELATYDW